MLRGIHRAVRAGVSRACRTRLRLAVPAGSHRTVRALHADEGGAAMVEYAIVTAVIAVVALTAAQAIGTSVVEVFTDISDALDGI